MEHQNIIDIAKSTFDSPDFERYRTSVDRMDLVAILSKWKMTSLPPEMGGGRMSPFTDDLERLEYCQTAIKKAKENVGQFFNYAAGLKFPDLEWGKIRQNLTILEGAIPKQLEMIAIFLDKAEIELKQKKNVEANKYDGLVLAAYSCFTDLTDLSINEKKGAIKVLIHNVRSHFNDHVTDQGVEKKIERLLKKKDKLG